MTPSIELLALEVADLAQRDVAAEMIVAVGVAAGTAQRTLAGDFDRERRSVAGEDATPRRNRSIPSLHYSSRLLGFRSAGDAMKRRTLLQWLARGCRATRCRSHRFALFAQPRELTPDAIADAS